MWLLNQLVMIEQCMMGLLGLFLKYDFQFFLKFGVGYDLNFFNFLSVGLIFIFVLMLLVVKGLVFLRFYFLKIFGFYVSWVIIEY